jgi:hypothetical protein
MLSPLLLALLLGAALSDVTGLVVDQSGGIVAGARVTLERASEEPLAGTTGPSGTFR